MWIHGLGGERLPAMSSTLFAQTWRKSLIFAIGEESRFFVVCFLYTSGQTFFSQTPGRRQPHITGVRVNSVTLRWVGSADERALFRCHDAIAVLPIDVWRGLGSPIKAWGGFHEHCACACVARAIKLCVSCPGEFKICPILHQNKLHDDGMWTIIATILRASEKKMKSREKFQLHPQNTYYLHPNKLYEDVWTIYRNNTGWFKLNDGHIYIPRPKSTPFFRVRPWRNVAHTPTRVTSSVSPQEDLT